jgi:anti-sigma factor RsiW
MNCHTVQNFLSAFIDCELDNELKREIRRHLFSCPECNVVYQELQNVKNCLECLDEPALEGDQLSRLFARLDGEKRLFIRQPSLAVWGPRLLVTAACVGIFFLTAVSFFPAASSNNATLANRSQSSDNYGSSESFFDRSFSCDQSITVYQASAILP